jgi:NAD(P)-dependent dehydrogenase (short-subunit alcohol dehydrogenase family)
MNGKKFLVTGCSSGIGRETSLKLASKGALVHGLSRSEEHLSNWIKEIGSSHQFHRIDLTDFSAFSDLANELPTLNGVVFSAGTGGLIPFRALSKELLDRYFQLNFYSPLLLLQQLLFKNKLAESASIVFLSSKAAELPGKAQLPYASSKAALIPAVKVLCQELSPKTKMRFNCVAPGILDTKMNESIQASLGKEQFEKLIAAQALGLGTAGDIANFICFLLSDDSRWISGSSFNADGGSCN